MSGTLYGVRSNVRELLDDLNPSTPVIADRRLNRLIDSRMQLLALQIGLGKSWSTAAITLVAGTADYTISGITVRQIEMLRLDDTKDILTKRSTETLALLRQNEANGQPTDYALWETALGVLTVGFYPTPTEADTVDRFGSVLPASLHNDVWVVSSAGAPPVTSLTTAVDSFGAVQVNDVVGGLSTSFLTAGTYVTVGGTTSLTINQTVVAGFSTTRLNFSAPIPFSDPMLRVLEAEVAAACISSMTDEQLAKLSIGREMAGVLREHGREGVMLENRRRMETQRQRHLTLIGR